MQDYPPYLFKSFAKTTGLCVRLYQNKQPAYYYSSTHLLPDPATLLMDEIFASNHRAGVIMTSLYQHYGYAHLTDGYLVVLGPTAALEENAAELEHLAFLLGVSEAEKPLYLKRLCCSPEISAEHLAWMLSFFITAVEGGVFGVENVYIATAIQSQQQEIAHAHTSETFTVYEDISLSKPVLTSYRFERILMQYIQNGQVEQLSDLLEALPTIQAGKMAKDTLRQTKNMFICGATSMSRAAIEGGLAPQSAFKLSDLYIQKCEILRDPGAVTAMIQEMALDFAGRVRALGYNGIQSSNLFEGCDRYIRQHLFSRILVKDIADSLGMSPSYLSTRFTAITGKTLTQFIQEQKIMEAKQLLRYTEKSIADIAMHLAFSSQSHFQNVFKQLADLTPLAYRRQYR